MEIHNLMEEKVMEILEEICTEDEQRDESSYCTSPQCKMDAACFVLNRIPQRYVSSGRGVAHSEKDITKDPQIRIDMVTLIHEGLRRVTTVQRNFYRDDQQADDDVGGIFYEFPLIKGRLFNGVNFEPINDCEVNLHRDGNTVEMIDSRWQNPFPMAANTPGTYLFWPHPLPAENIDQQQDFNFDLVVNHQDYEPFCHSFTLKLTANNIDSIRAIKSMRDFNVQDLFLLPKGDEIR